ncbi:MAG: hypothetical protein KF809_06095 [Chloroflexi bacterium]|nr:hypothetical protein [Chloroflexota bacterium]
MPVCHTLRRAAPAGLLATLLSAGSAAAFTPTVTVEEGDPGDQIEVTDLAGRGPRVAITSWHRAGGATGYVLSMSDDAGATWSQASSLDPDFREPQVAICDGRAAVAYTDEYISGYRDVLVDARPFAGGEDGFERITSARTTRGPDVTCIGGDEVVVAFFQQTSSGWGVRVRTTGDALDVFGSGPGAQGFSIGSGTPSRGLGVAASGDRLYVTWFDGNKLRLRRFAIGQAPGNVLTRITTSTIATVPGGRNPRIGAAGSRVFVTYSKGPDLVVRRSTNKGVSFGGAKTLRNLPNASEVGALPTTVAVNGTRAVIGAVEVGGIETLTGKGLSYRTTNGGSSWTRVHSHSGGRTVAGLIKADDAQRLIEAWDQSISQPSVQRIRSHRATD